MEVRSKYHTRRTNGRPLRTVQVNLHLNETEAELLTIAAQGRKMAPFVRGLIGKWLEPVKKELGIVAAGQEGGPK